VDPVASLVVAAVVLGVEPVVGGHGARGEHARAAGATGARSRS
jgi:hypothetical protein